MDQNIRRTPAVHIVNGSFETKRSLSKMSLSAYIRGFTANTINALECKRNVHSSTKFFSIADGGAGTHKPTPFQQKVLVWTRTYAEETDIPKRITTSQMKNAMDKFRGKVLIGIIGASFVSAGIVAMYGRRELDEWRHTHNAE